MDYNHNEFKNPDSCVIDEIEYDWQIDDLGCLEDGTIVQVRSLEDPKLMVQEVNGKKYHKVERNNLYPVNACISNNEYFKIIYYDPATEKVIMWNKLSGRQSINKSEVWSIEHRAFAD